MMTSRRGWRGGLRHGIDRPRSPTPNRVERKRARQRRLPFLERLEDILLLSTVNETEPNNVLALATPYQFTQDPAASGFFTSLGLGAINPGGDVDYWSFPALKGDHVTISGDG